MTTVDVTEDMGPFEVAPGTQWEPGTDFDHGMFPPRSEAPRYAALAQRKLPRMGDASVRSALTIHRGTAHRSWRARPVLVIGVDAPGAGNADRHDLQMTHDYYRSLPAEARANLPARLVEKLEPLTQEHTIEGARDGRAVIYVPRIARTAVPGRSGSIGVAADALTSAATCKTSATAASCPPRSCWPWRCFWVDCSC